MNNTIQPPFCVWSHLVYKSHIFLEHLRKKGLNCFLHWLFFSRNLIPRASRDPIWSSILIVVKVTNSCVTTITWSKCGMHILITFSLTNFLVITWQKLFIVQTKPWIFDAYATTISLFYICSNSSCFLRDYNLTSFTLSPPS